MKWCGLRLQKEKPKLRGLVIMYTNGIKGIKQPKRNGTAAT